MVREEQGLPPLFWSCVETSVEEGVPDTAVAIMVLRELIDNGRQISKIRVDHS